MSAWKATKLTRGRESGRNITCTGDKATKDPSVRDGHVVIMTPNFSPGGQFFTENKDIIKVNFTCISAQSSQVHR